jgi:hypothetical protein
LNLPLKKNGNISSESNIAFGEVAIRDNEEDETINKGDQDKEIIYK